MRKLLYSAIVVIGGCLLAACETETSEHIVFEELSASEVDSLNIINRPRETDTTSNFQDSTLAQLQGSIGDTWKKYFRLCLKSEVEATTCYISMSNTDGPGVLYNSRLGSQRKDISSILPANVYSSLIETTRHTPGCPVTSDEYKIIGDFLQATFIKLLNINPAAEGTKLDTILFNINSYKTVTLRENIFDSLYTARNSDPALQNYFEDFTSKKIQVLTKAYVISGISADMQFSRLDSSDLSTLLDSGLEKKLNGKLGFKFKRDTANHVIVSTQGDCIPLVQYMKVREVIVH